MQNDITLRPGRPEDAPQIARLIVTAMSDECCRHFYGEHHTADDFLRLITRLAASRNTQYSYENAICAIVRTGSGISGNNNETDNHTETCILAGVSVSYDGARLYELRQAFIDGAKKEFGIDHSSMSPETQAGELYLDSLAVLPEYRGRGIATMLLKATADKARRSGAGPLGLLVDENNPLAEHIYNKVGFRFVGNNDWGGHRMRHLQLL